MADKSTSIEDRLNEIEAELRSLGSLPASTASTKSWAAIGWVVAVPLASLLFVMFALR